MLINRNAVRKLIMSRLEKLRPHLKFDRVSAQTYHVLEARIRTMIDAEIQSHPSVGKTFKIE